MITFRYTANDMTTTTEAEMSTTIEEEAMTEAMVTAEGMADIK
jgi:hypothetical protein